MEDKGKAAKMPPSKKNLKNLKIFSVCPGFMDTGMNDIPSDIKKLISFVLMCLMALSMSAQKCAVLEFRGSASVSVADIDGISEMFISLTSLISHLCWKFEL